MWSATELVTPAGKKTTAQKWARELHVPYAPTMVFFDAAGAEVFRVEAYLKAFHVQSVLDYVASGAYRQYPEFQRFIDARADGMRSRGITVDLMK
jgi:thioredoxin-related protein